MNAAPLWTTALPDWQDRLLSRQSLMPCGALFPDEAKASMDVFRALRVVDVAGAPAVGDCFRPWAMDFAEAVFGAYDPVSGRRLIREFFLAVAKKNAKSTIAAAIMLTALLRNWRKSAEFLIVAPTVEVAQNSFKPAADMVRADEDLNDMLHVQDHYRTITHRLTGAVLKVVAADNDTVSGKKATGVLVDELWLFGKRSNADSMLAEATGGLVARPEGFVIYLSTHADEPPAGVFKTKLAYFRGVRDGTIKDPKSLGVLYEFPRQMLEAEAYREPENFWITNPNLGASVDREWLLDKQREYEESADETAKRVFYAKHLNVEIGIALGNDSWPGARYWQDAADKSLASLDALLARCDVVTVGIDGGGLDDLLGLAVIGRCKETRRWLHWGKAWAHNDVFERRKEIVPRLNDFIKEGTLVRCDEPTQDVREVADVVARLWEMGVLPEKAGIGLDPVGVAQIIDELASRGIPDDAMASVFQGYKLAGAIEGTARKLKDGTLLHGGTDMMAWVVGNAKVEQRGNAVLITKQVAGKAKIDPLAALFDAAQLMSRNPVASGHGGPSFWEAAA